MAAMNSNVNTESHPQQQTKDAKDASNDAKETNPNSQSKIQDTLQVQFTTKIADKSMQCDDTIYALTSKLRPQALSQVVNHVLNNKDESQCVDFDFLIDNKYLRTPLAQHLSENEISSEQTILIEYIEKTIEPSAKTNNQHPDWVSCVDAIRANTFITGCYDGVIRVWKPSDTDTSQTTLFCQHRGHISPIKGITALYSSKNVYYFSSVAKDRSVKVFGLNESTKQVKQVGKIDVKSANQSHRFTVECCSAPYPSKVFATGSADREIKIYRLRNKDTVDTEGPAMKKRKLNAGEAQLNTFVEDESSNKSSSISNTSSLKSLSKSKAFTKTFGVALDSIPWDKQPLVVANHMQFAPHHVHSPHAPPQWLQNTENLPPKVPHTNSVNSSSTTSSSNSFGITFANTSNQTAMTSTNKPLLNKSITKPLSNDTFFHVNTKPKRKKFSIKTKGKGKRKGKRKQKQLKWFENQAIFQKTKVLGTLFHRVWKKVDWKSVSKDDVAWDKLTAFERGTMALAVKGEPMRIDDINKFITENVSGRIDGTGTMILCATRSGKACAAYEDGYYFVLSDTEDSDDEDASDAEDTPGEICKAMWDCIIDNSPFLKSLKSD
eukprot:841264_1